MESIAKDNSHGYDQIHRWGPTDYDCSGLSITAWERVGVLLKEAGATYTGNLGPALLKCGFEDITDKIDLETGKGLKRGDVLLAKGHHVAQYCGNGKEVEASINEKGKVTGGKPGDQTGREIKIRSYHNHPWTNVYRYVGDEKTEKPTPKKTVNTDHDHYKVTANNGLNIRKSPNGSIILAIPNGSIVSFDDDQKAISGWTAIDKYKIPNGSWISKKGYCSSQYLKKV